MRRCDPELLQAETSSVSDQSRVNVMSGEQVRRMREDLGINQTEFWSKIGMTQSAGSRYETGRTIPKPVVMLLMLVYETDEIAESLLANLRNRRHTHLQRRHRGGEDSANLAMGISCT